MAAQEPSPQVPLPPPPTARMRRGPQEFVRDAISSIDAPFFSPIFNFFVINPRVLSTS